MTLTLTAAERVIRAHLTQLATGTVYEYEYRLDPIDPQAIEVRRATQGAQWFSYGEFASRRTAAIALEALRLAQERERAEREEVGV